MRPDPRIPRQVRAARKVASVAREAVVVVPRGQTGWRGPLGFPEASAVWEGWWSAQGWTPFSFQTQAWDAYHRGKSGLITVPTGSGKTYAAFGGPLVDLLTAPDGGHQGLRILYVSPMRALVRDIASALRRPLADLGLPFEVGVRTGDSTSGERARLRRRLPDILVTTPESLALLLTDTDAQSRLGDVRAVVVDEWHELIGSKRGSLLELSLARLRRLAPGLRLWALSATIGNLDEAARLAVGENRAFEVVQDLRIERRVAVRSILPKHLPAFPWFGFSGLRLCPEVIAGLDPDVATLVFTNTRSQAERWFEHILRAKPEWASVLGLHHGSLDRTERERVENGVKDGSIRIVVATSSLDLGVDFPRVQKIIQIGTVKGFGRALQRAGRAFHRPGEATAIWICPSHLFETIEISALREGLKRGALERRRPFSKPMDVLVQFLLNSAYGTGFTRAEMSALLKDATSFRDVTDGELDWALRLLTDGGPTLQAYPEFRKLALVGDRYQFADARLARLHKMNIGTIVSESGMQIKFLRGASLGTLDESFVSGLRPGSLFHFSGRTLRLLHVRDMTAYVQLAKGGRAVTPAWDGRLFPISPDLATALRLEVDRLARGDEHLSPELTAFRAAALRQEATSKIPRADELLVERWQNADGHYLFAYPFLGRAMHEGLGHLLAHRLAKQAPNSISVSANEYGFALLSARPLGADSEVRAALSDRRGLADDVEASLNVHEMAKRAFREIARVAGLIQQGSARDRKTVRHLQMSSALFFDVFLRYDPKHLLLQQAFREVRERQLHLEALEAAMLDLEKRAFLFETIPELTPFSFPLYVERIGSRFSSEQLDDQIARLQRRLRDRADRKDEP